MKRYQTISYIVFLGVGSLYAFTTRANENASIAKQARLFLKERPKLQREDCSGFVEAVLQSAGIPNAKGSTRTFWKEAREEGRLVAAAEVQPGDLAFFDATYDANRNGRVDDKLTHIAIVTAVEPDGRVVLVNRLSGRIKRLHLDRLKRGLYRQGGVLHNDYLRARQFGPRGGKRLAGQLLRGFARPPQREPPFRLASVPAPSHAVSSSSRGVRGAKMTSNLRQRALQPRQHSLARRHSQAKKRSKGHGPHRHHSHWKKRDLHHHGHRHHRSCRPHHHHHDD